MLQVANNNLHFFRSSAIQVSVFSATSKTTILRWTRVSGASSYKITVAPKNSPSNPVAFAMFGPNTVLGSVNSLSQNTIYIFTVDALDDSQQTLSSAALESSTGESITVTQYCISCSYSNIKMF